jgi:hypothetical protein
MMDVINMASHLEGETEDYETADNGTIGECDYAAASKKI